MQPMPNLRQCVLDARMCLLAVITHTPAYTELCKETDKIVQQVEDLLFKYFPKPQDENKTP